MGTSKSVHMITLSDAIHNQKCSGSERDSALGMGEHISKPNTSRPLTTNPGSAKHVANPYHVNGATKLTLVRVQSSSRSYVEQK